MLRPQDILLALKLLSPNKNTSSFVVLGASIGLPKAATAQGIDRLVASRLIRAGTLVPYRSAISNVLIKGVPYFLPAPVGPEDETAVTGLATGQHIAMLPQLGEDATPMVWPTEGGNHMGYALKPLCPEAPEAAAQDPFVYRLLALTDLVRSQRSTLKERSVAAQAIETQILSDVLREQTPVTL